MKYGIFLMLLTTRYKETIENLYFKELLLKINYLLAFYFKIFIKLNLLSE